MNEKKAIQLCLDQKDPAGFKYLIRQYRREAYLHALGFLGNALDAEDACQEAFVRAFRAIPRLKKLDSFYPWFYTILKHYCYTVLGNRKKSENYTVDTSGEQSDSRKAFDPSVLLEQNEHTGYIWRILGSLEPEFREILVLKYLEEMDYETISTRLGIVRGTVMSRLYYARRAFRREYIRYDNIGKGGTL